MNSNLGGDKTSIPAKSLDAKAAKSQSTKTKPDGTEKTEKQPASGAVGKSRKDENVTQTSKPILSGRRYEEVAITSSQKTLGTEKVNARSNDERDAAADEEA